MDEILASIRRIIETGEDRNGAPVARSPFRDASLRAVPSLAPVAQPEPEADAPSDPQVAGSVSSFDPAGSDEDRLTAQLETELAATWGDVGSGETPAVGKSEAFQAEQLEDDQTEVSMTAGTQNGWAPFEAPSGTIREDAVDRNESPAQSHGEEGRGLEVEEPLPAFRPANTDLPAPLPVEHATASRPYEYRGDGDALLSERSGTLVASSFEELAQAIRNGELRSIETMAQDMLRPMLREWLDDNLPHMVERLVREEIERMARGGRR